MFQRSITHIDDSKLNIPNDHKLKLNGILHALRVASNLVSVGRLCFDNDIKLHGNCFYVKEKYTREVLLEGLAGHGLYIVWNKKDVVSNVASIRMALLASSSIWHNRLALCSLIYCK